MICATLCTFTMSNSFWVVQNGVKNIQASGYDGARKVIETP